MKNIAILKYIEDETVWIFFRLDALNGLVGRSDRIFCPRRPFR